MATRNEDMMDAIAQELVSMDADADRGQGDAQYEMDEAEGQDSQPMQETMDEAEILSVINSEMQNATTGSYATAVDQDRAEALKYYLGNPRGDEIEGRSQVISTDVADAIEWILPQIMKAMTAKGPVVTFDALSENDEMQAELETEFTHDVFMKENDGFLNLYEFVKDALMMKNGVFKIYYDDTPETTTEDFSGLDMQELQMLLSDPDVEPVDVNQYPDESMKPQYEQAMQQYQQMQQQGQMQLANIAQQAQNLPPEQQGQAQQQVQQLQMQLQQPPPEMPMLFDVTLERVTSKGRVVVDTVAPEEFRVNQYHNSLNLSDARFVAHSTLKTMSELIEEGFDPETLKDHQNSVDDYYRREYRFAEQDETTFSQYGYSEDESQSLFEITECYMNIDLNGDDIAELMKITVIGSEDVTTILDMEGISEIPFVSSSCIIMPHKYIGLSIYDRLKMIQDQKTSLWRNILDNLYLQNNREKEVVEGQVNLDDLLTSRPGGIKRVKQPGMIRELQVQPIGQEGYQMMEYLDQVRTGRVGVSPETQGQALMVGNDTAHGIERLMTAKEELTGLMIRVVAETGLKEAYKLIRDLLIRHQDSTTPFKFKDKWIDVNPNNWGPRARLSVRVGTGTGDDQRKQGALQMFLGYQEKLMQDQNQTLVDYQRIYNALDDLSLAAELNGAGKYFIDPETPDGQQMAQEKAQQAQMQQQQQQVLQQQMAEAQSMLAEGERMKGQAAVDKQRSDLLVKDMEMELKAQKDRADNEIDTLQTQLKAIESGAKQKFDYDKLEQDEALKLTELEVTNNRELNKQYLDNQKTTEAATETTTEE